MFSITGNNALLCPCHCPLCRHPSSHHSLTLYCYLLLLLTASLLLLLIVLSKVCTYLLRSRYPFILNHWRKKFEIEFVCLWQCGSLDTLPHTNIPLSPNLCQHEQDLWCYLNGNWVTLHLHLYILLSSVIYKPTYKLLRMLPDLLIQFGTIKWYNLAF